MKAIIFDLDNTQVFPPNNVTFDLNGVVVGDRILIGKKGGGNDFDFTEMTLATALDGGTETQVDVGLGNIPADAPQTGTIRIVLDDGRIRRQPYTAIDAGLQYFTITSADYLDPDDASISNGVMLAFIDKAAASDPESFTVVYDAVRTLWVRVRDGGATPIKTYEAQAALNDTGGQASALRIDDA